jgi:hypothetical protein
MLQTKIRNTKTINDISVKKSVQKTLLRRLGINSRILQQLHMRMWHTFRWLMIWSSNIQGDENWHEVSLSTLKLKTFQEIPCALKTDD